MLSHAWVLPAFAVQRLKSSSSLKLSYSLTLLEPHEFSLPTDGRNHALPGVGLCSAELDAPRWVNVLHGQRTRLDIGSPRLAKHESVTVPRWSVAAIQRPDYGAVKIPALAIYAFEDPNKPLPPWYDANDKETLANLAERARIGDAMKRKNNEAFRHGVEKGRGLEMPRASAAPSAQVDRAEISAA